MSEHIKYGFLAGVYELYVRFEGSEWGDQMRPLSAAFSMGQDYAGFNNEEMEAINNILFHHIEAMYEYGDYEEHYPEEFKAAQQEYPKVYKDWERICGSDQELKVLLETANALPGWIKGNT